MTDFQYQGKNIVVPKDIKRRIWKRIAIRILILLSLLAVAITVCYFTRESKALNDANYTLLCILILIVPFWVTKVPFALIDSTWCAEILETKVTTEVRQSVLTGRGSGGGIYYLNVCYMKLRLDSGKIVTRKMLEERIHSHSSRADLYKVGDTVLHVYGCKHLQILSRHPREQIICVICGTAQPEEDVCCSKCGHTLSLIGTDGQKGEDAHGL